LTIRHIDLNLSKYQMSLIVFVILVRSIDIRQQFEKSLSLINIIKKYLIAL